MKEYSPSESHAVLISELTDLRRHLWTLIAVFKQLAHWIPNSYRSSALKAMAEAEEALTR